MLISANFFKIIKIFLRATYTLTKVTKVHIPPKIYTSEHDIAMVEFEEIKFSDYIRPICLPM